VLRTVLLVPRFGERTAELLELPVMLGVCWLAARWVTARQAVPPRPAPASPWARLQARCCSPPSSRWCCRCAPHAREYFASRDPVAGAAYYLAVAIMVLMPTLAGRRP